MNTLSQRLSSLGRSLPIPKAPVANYQPFVRCGDLLFIAGQIGYASAAAGGLVGAGLSEDEGRHQAEVAALMLLAVINQAVEGDIARIDHVLRLGVFIAAAPYFDGHSAVADGASNLVVAVLGECGRHVRTAVGVASLPAGAAVEVDAVVRIR